MKMLRLLITLLFIFSISSLVYAEPKANKGQGAQKSEKMKGAAPSAETSELLPPGLSKKGEMPKGLSKQDKIPAGWGKGKKTGWGKAGSGKKK